MITLTNLNEVTLIEELDYKTESWALREIGATDYEDEVMWHGLGEGVKILSIDTGVNYNHIDLKSAYTYGYNHFTKKRNPLDDNGHGTHVAGLLTGRCTGVSPSSNLYSVKILDNHGRGGYRGLLDALIYAIQYKVDVVNISLGTIDEKLPMLVLDKIADAYRKGIIIVSATGNSGGNELLLPASMNEVIAVGGVDKDLNRASFSNHGTGIDCVAPAVDVLSTYNDGKYALMSGTSVASPLVAGGIALMVSHYREKGVKLTTKMVRELLSQMNDEPYSHEVGYGLFDLNKLLK